ncbi:hypothetical protein ADIS_4097 [Lunatimonas lonarensis]|uniref:Uncharacterized protein n=1 Tax=Lunatimonas lonarensis TaxID=1232681 RepID=R7ZMS9_9BACT|nr:hypothetical protein ADIS_4097 [Lunatimonas lonarensis]
MFGYFSSIAQNVFIASDWEMMYLYSKEHSGWAIPVCKASTT